MLWLKQVINISGSSTVLLGLFLLILKPVVRKIESTPASLNQVIVILSLTVITLVIFPNVLYILYTFLPLSLQLLWLGQENDSKGTLTSKQVCGASVQEENYEGVFYVVTTYCPINRNLSS